MQLLAVFRDPNKKEEQLKQGIRPVAEFFVEFEEHKSLAGYIDEGYIVLLKRNLTPQVLEQIYALEMIPTNDQWKSYALCFDLYKYQALRGGCMGDAKGLTPDPSLNMRLW